MTPATIIQKAMGHGVWLTLTPAGTIRARGNADAVRRWLPMIRDHKPGIVVALQEAASEAETIGREAFDERAAILEYDGSYSRSDAEQCSVGAGTGSVCPAHGAPAAGGHASGLSAVAWQVESACAVLVDFSTEKRRTVTNTSRHCETCLRESH